MVNSGGYETISHEISTGDLLMLAKSPAIKPCVEIVSAGTDNQGAVVQSWTDPDITLSVFEMSSPNLEYTFAPIDVTVRATGLHTFLYAYAVLAKIIYIALGGYHITSEQR